MRSVILATLALFGTLVMPSVAYAQSDLDKLDEKLTRQLEKAMPGWKHERVEPFGDSGNVLIQFWSFSERKVKISIIVHQSASEAREVFERHARYESNKEQLSDLGDEAFAEGYGSADVAFRKGKMTVYVSTTAEIGARPEERMLNQSERFALMRSEMRRWSREFARHSAQAIDGP
jgi:hypothetical protein